MSARSEARKAREVLEQITRSYEPLQDGWVDRWLGQPLSADLVRSLGARTGMVVDLFLGTAGISGPRRRLVEATLVEAERFLVASKETRAPGEQPLRQLRAYAARLMARIVLMGTDWWRLSSRWRAWRIWRRAGRILAGLPDSCDVHAEVGIPVTETSTEANGADPACDTEAAA